MRIAIGSDHAGYELKRYIIAKLREEGYECVDFGVDSRENADYPDVSYEVALAVARGNCDFGILICGTGIGSSIVANKVCGVRCSLCLNEYMAAMARAHNDANVLALGARVLGNELAWNITKTWLTTPFSNEERHVRRVRKISLIERVGKGCLTACINKVE
ncbi:MAG: ribose 5-phosphate isomerase B [Armatimonadetes bacterium]|nr:ribose 5-phosphate isomerase B [Armatimonadota bacterium]MCX7778052.1 ribose 5-phosphate isomerase B [Armatimonadota bacterium]